MATKIQINSLEALERLIGGDTETEIEIRNSIVQEFTKKHLKGVAQEEVIQHVETQIRRDLHDIIKVSLDARGFQYKLKEPILSYVANAITAHLKKAVDDYFKVEFQKKFEEMVDNKLKTYSNLVSSSINADELERIVRKIIDEKVTKLMNLKG